MTLDFKYKGDLIFLLGTTQDEINSIEYLANIVGTLGSPAPYFNLEEDEKARIAFASERERIIQKMEEAKNGGASTRKPQPKNPFHFHCDSMDETSKGIFIKE